MRCPKCGGENADDANFCQFCGEKFGPSDERRSETQRRLRDLKTVFSTRPRRDSDYLGWSVFMIFFCSPLAIVPLVLAFTARSRYAKADYSGASRLAKTARTCFWFAVVIGLIAQSLYIYRNKDALMAEFMAKYHEAAAVLNGESVDGDPERKFETVDSRPGPSDETNEREEKTIGTVEKAEPVETSAQTDASNAGDSESDAVPVRGETTTQTESLGDFLKSDRGK